MDSGTNSDNPVPRVLLLMPATSYRAADFMEAAQRLGVQVTVGSNHEQVLASFAPGRCLSLAFAPLDQAVDNIVAHAAPYPFTAVVGTDDETSLLAALAARRLNLAHNSPASVRTAHDKYRFRRALADAGLPSPWFRKISVPADVTAAASSAQYPCVLKPLSLSGSRGVIRANDEAQFVQAYRRIESILAAVKSHATRDSATSILVESFMPGREVALEGLMHRGELRILALFDKPDPLDGPYFEESLYVTPSRLAVDVQEDVALTTARAASVLGLTDGPVHAELRVNEAGAWLIELAARTIGGLCSRALTFTQTAKLEELVLRQALGQPIDNVDREQSAAGVMMIPIPAAGRLRAVAGIENARAVPGIEDIVISIPSGDRVVPLPEGDRYLGFIFAKAETPDQVEAALRSGHRHLAIEIEPPSREQA